ncbi:UDP-N-acetylmuramoyl-L-alanine--D-glutamate ligase [Pseudoalteromonas ruthenica]|uniref:UDP-N-acetylmuramoyl-L-alanine--D-glutamate ligase n=1 Tax=Pseudoalteromonas ruthenica TaxID=151081 RepID=UPI0012477225|nr:UDP-N-acetylmuramoyl-L-alanine--D-glutamate ligase [Pseudoalteromonas ruthenica]
MSYLDTLKNKRIAVLGLGISGLGTVRFLHAHNLHPVLIDSRQQVPTQLWLDSHVPHLERRFGDFDKAELTQFDVIIIAPGIALSTPQVRQAIAEGVEVIGDVELFARLNNKPVLAVTGSNGKSTVVSLLAKVLECGGLQVGLGGNIGTAVLDLLAQDMDAYVLELSSFQLETTTSLAAKSACILNLCEDHLDRYTGMADYICAKQRIYQDCQLAVYNRGDADTYPEHASQPLSFALHDADYHIMQHQGESYFAYRNSPLLPCRKTVLPGSHNQLNVLAVMALCHDFHFDIGVFERALSEFKGLDHRCQYVTTLNDVRYFNDSKATNVGATLAAIKGLAAEPGRLILLAGGDAKGADLTPLKETLAEQVAELICFGKDGDAIAALKPGSHRVSGMGEAVQKAKACAQAGDIVLLAPACASLDMYSNYMARGNDFIQQVLEESS